MELGKFSLSLTVKDIAASRAFYEKLGFEPVGGDQSRNWLVLHNGNATIGLFQDMFPRNILTFNPGWDAEGNEADSFTDIRDLQKTLAERDVAFESTIDAGESGPASFIIVDPDGNQILFDQHR